MARPERHDADYFPFFAKRGKTLNILQAKFGLEGIGFFTNLLRFLALTPDHHYRIETPLDQMNLFAEIGITVENRGLEILDLLAMTGKIDSDLWYKNKVIVSEDFLKSLEDAYSKRNNDIITMQEIRDKYTSNSHTNVLPEPETTPDVSKSNDNEVNNPQSKVKESKVKESKVVSSQIVSQFQMTNCSNDGMSRISSAQKYWNLQGLIASKKMIFSNDDTPAMLDTIRAYTDDEITNAIQNYSKIITSSDHEVAFKYGSFQGFMKKGVEKFVDNSDPWNVFRKKEAVRRLAIPDDFSEYAHLTAKEP